MRGVHRDGAVALRADTWSQPPVKPPAVQLTESVHPGGEAAGGGGGGVGTGPWCRFACLWQRLLASRHCTFRPSVGPGVIWLCQPRVGGGGGGRDALEGQGPQRGPQKRLGRRLEAVAKAIGGGYCRLQMPLRLALGVRGTVAGHRLAPWRRGGGGYLPPFRCIPGGAGGFHSLTKRSWWACA